MKLLRTALILALAASSTACSRHVQEPLRARRPSPATTGEYGRISARGPARRSHRPRRAAAACSGRSPRRRAVRRAEIFQRRAPTGYSWRARMTATHGETSIPVGGNRHGHQGSSDVPLQHDRYRHLPGHVEHRRELRRHVVQRAGQRLGNDQAIVTSLFR